jgi:hypothetical protein
MNFLPISVPCKSQIVIIERLSCGDVRLSATPDELQKRERAHEEFRELISVSGSAAHESSPRSSGKRRSPASVLERRRQMSRGHTAWTPRRLGGLPEREQCIVSMRMTEEQRERIKRRLRERMEQMPEGLERNRLHNIGMRLALGDSPRNIHEILRRPRGGER